MDVWRGDYAIDERRGRAASDYRLGWPEGAAPGSGDICLGLSGQVASFDVTGERRRRG